MTDAASSPQHPFVRAPHRTFVGLSVPVLFSLVAEPLTGLVDTAFVARLGAEALAALGVGAIVLSGTFWIFNFLGIGTQTEVAQALGRQAERRARQISGLALSLAGAFGVLLIGLGWLGAAPVAALMGAEGVVQTQAVVYIQIRLLGAPAVLATVAAFGTFRGQADMRTPLWIAVAINLLNIALDYPLVFGWGPVPALGIAGAAWASTASQWLGAAWAVALVLRRLGRPQRIPFSDVRALLKIGGDLFVRTGMLTLFLLLATRAATRAGAEAGAAHQAVRQVWAFTALFLDAFAITGQSLVGYFVGAGQTAQARRVAAVVCGWSLGTGVLLGLAMWAGTGLAADLLVPPEAVGLFGSAWLLAALTQPLNALTFGTDGIHWGTGDFRYLRNAVSLATLLGALALYLLDETRSGALDAIWLITGGWIVVRAAFGLLRIWPGVGAAPLALSAASALEGRLE